MRRPLSIVNQNKYIRLFHSAHDYFALGYDGSGDGQFAPLFDKSFEQSNISPGESESIP